MKMADNVETEATELEASDSRASRMARYSAAAAGVAAVSSIEVDAALVKVTVTDLAAQNTSSYALDLSAISANASMAVGRASSRFTFAGNGASIASKANTNEAETFGPNATVSANLPTGWATSPGDILSSGTTFYGFRVANANSSDYNYGWMKVQAASPSLFTLHSYGYNSTTGEAAVTGQGSAPSQVPDSGPGIVGLVMIGAGAAGVRLLRKLRFKG